MKPREYDAVREELGWTHLKIAETIGVSPRTPFRYASGDTAIPGPVERLLRLLVLLRLTLNQRKFEEIAAELRDE